MSGLRRRPSLSVQFAAVAVCLGVSLYLSWLVVQPFVGVLAWAGVIVMLFSPVHRRVERRLGANVWSAVVSTVLVIVTVLVPVAAALVATAQELRALADGAPGSLGMWLDPSRPGTGPIVAFMGQFVDVDRLRDPEFIRDALERSASGLAAGSLRVVGNAASALVQMALIVFAMFFLFKDGVLVSRSLYDFVPIDNRRLYALYRRTKEVVEASVYGTLLLAAIQGAMGGVAFLVLGLPSPFLWGLVMAFAAIIPLLGAFVVWLPAAVYLAVTGQMWQAAALTAWGSVAIGMADNVLRPVLVGNRTRMHELLVFFGVLGGIQVFGLLGVVLGPVIFAITLALIQGLRELGPDIVRARPIRVSPPLRSPLEPQSGT